MLESETPDRDLAVYTHRQAILASRLTRFGIVRDDRSSVRCRRVDFREGREEHRRGCGYWRNAASEIGGSVG